MTPAPISVERLREVIAFLLGEGELDNRWFGDGSAPLVAGKYRAPYWWRTQLRETTDSLLHQLAEAERAKEEFRLLASLRLFHAPTIGYCWFERSGVSWTGKAHATINEANAEKTAAFLAASGGAKP